MRSLTLTLALPLGLLLTGPTAGAMPTGPQIEPRRQNVMTRLLRQVKQRVRQTWRSWSQPPTRAQALRPLQRMINSGRISGGDLERVRALYPELGGAPSPKIRSSRSDPRMKPLFRMLDSGRISTTDFVRIEQALGR